MCDAVPCSAKVMPLCGCLNGIAELCGLLEQALVTGHLQRGDQVRGLLQEAQLGVATLGGYCEARRGQVPTPPELRHGATDRTRCREGEACMAPCHWLLTISITL